MVDNPNHFNERTKKTRCRTLEPDRTCQDCRLTPLEEIYTAHFTVCGKPDACLNWEHGLCTELFREWHKVRLLLEMDWMAKFPGYVPELRHHNASESREQELLGKYQGHCHGTKYLPLRFPNSGKDLLID